MEKGNKPSDGGNSSVSGEKMLMQLLDMVLSFAKEEMEN